MNPMLKSTVAFWLAAFNLTIVFGSFGYLMADNQPPYTYYADKSYVKPNPAKMGHQVTVHWEIKVNRICRGVITRSIIDARTRVIVSYDPAPALGLPTTSEYIERTFYLPDSIEPGMKIYRVSAEYTCNVLQRFWPLKVQTPDIYFEIK